jgi:hypothetical protein
MRRRLLGAAAILFLAGLALWFEGGQPAPAQIMGPFWAGASSGVAGCPAAPAGAVAAGFTTCIADYDWTGVTQSSVNGSNITLGAVANWLECQGTSGYATGSGRQFAISKFQSNPLQPCSNVAIYNDGGTNVLRLTYTPSSTLGTMAIQTTNEDNGYTPTNPFEVLHLTAAYIEFRKRENSNNETNCPWTISQGVNCLMDDTWQWYTSGGDIEYDFSEAYSNPVSFGDAVDWDNGGSHPVNTPSSLTDDIFNYHTIGVRITTNGTSAIGLSWYVDNSFFYGASFTPTKGAAAYDDTHYLVLTDGEQGSNLGEVCSGGTCKAYNGPIVTYYQWIHIYSCSNYSAGQCYGSVLTTAP